MNKNDKIVFPVGVEIDTIIRDKILEFVKLFNVYEISLGTSLVLYQDKKSEAFYLNCHLTGQDLVNRIDLEASLDGDDDEIYKLNRDITEDKTAYKIMLADARNGRSFEDLVLEYDTSYKPEAPLKVYGGQHRINAINKSGEVKKNTIHGTRVYFNLSRSQKVEIATVNNTSIAVPNDLLDRMEEQLLGPELREWCQAVGLLEKNEDFADKRDPRAPTVRIARTLIVNFYKGMNAAPDEFHQPVVCKSGSKDKDYNKIRPSINWNSSEMLEMGREFSKLHRIQRDSVLNRSSDNYSEFARKTFSLAVVAGWSYASGMFQKKPDFLKKHYSLPDSTKGTDDPLNAKALSEARLKGIDPDTYRGLGTRSDSSELGRMLEVFIVAASKSKSITKKLAEVAIKTYEAKKAQHVANAAMNSL